MLENRVRYADWATAWNQHWWTGGPIDRPSTDPTLPRVDIEATLNGPAGTLYHLVAHEVGHLLDRDYGGGLRRLPDNKPFEPGEFGYLSWMQPWYVGENGVVQGVARDSAFEAVRTLDFDGNVKARIAMLNAAGTDRPFDPGTLAVVNWQPASRDGIATFLDRLEHSPFTTVFSTWRPADDWTESFAVMTMRPRPEIRSRNGKLPLAVLMNTRRPAIGRSRSAHSAALRSGPTRLNLASSLSDPVPCPISSTSTTSSFVAWRRTSASARRTSGAF